MKKTILFLLVASLGTGVFAQTTWTADKAHSQVSFEITHLGINDVEGLFRTFDATIVSSKEDFSDAIFEVKIEVNSIDTGIKRRDDHLRNPDFFEVEKYPEMTFRSKNIKKIAPNKYQVIGDLNFHGVTKPITLEVWHRGTVTNQKGETSGFQVTGKINRSDFNFGEGFSGVTLSDEVRFEFNGEFKKV